MLLISKSPLIAKVAYESLGLELDIGSLFFSILVVQEGKIQAILVWHDHQKRHNAWWTIVSFDKRWCTKKVLKYFFFLAFDYFGLNHINAMTRVSNTHANRFLTRLGFQKQGRLKNAYLTLDAPSDAIPSDATPDAPSHPEQGAVADVPTLATPTPDAPSYPEQGAVRLFEDAFLWQKMSSKNLITGF